MRITITRDEKQESEKTGIFSKKVWTNHRVLTTVEFSELELATIRKHKLGDAALYEHTSDFGYGPVHYRYTIDKLIAEKTWVRGFKTPLEANNCEHELKTEILPNLKNYIEGNADMGPKSETFEL